MKHELNDQELFEKLLLTLDKLSKLCLIYDEGNISIAEEIAVKIRLLFHNTRNSTALVSKLVDLPSRFIFSAGRDYDPTNLAKHMPLVAFQFRGKEHPIYTPEKQPFTFQTRILFNKWWKEQLVLIDEYGNKFTRKGLILNVADTDGGAHVDSKVNKSYYDLSRNNSIGLTYSAGLPSEEEKEKFSMGNPVFPSIRVIAEEVIITLHPDSDISQLPIG